MRPTILLYDIDGTLVSAGGAGRRAIERAFADHYGRPDAVAHLRFDGMTDPAIVRAGLRALGAPDDASTVDAVLEAYIVALAEEITTSACVVHPGVIESLDAAAATPRVAIGLGTGNIARGAQVKLGRAGLAARFAFGGFGSDAEHRPALIQVGAERGAARLGAARDDCRVVVIGDTPLDVAAALAIGADCVGVGTGRFSARDLRDAGATWAFDTLSDPGALKAILG